MNVKGRLAAVAAAILLPAALVTMASPGTSYAEECAAGTVFDPVSNACVAQPPPVNMAPGPICVPIPIPFVILPPVCFGPDGRLIG